MSLFRELNAILPTTDTPRGLVVSLPDQSFRDADLDDRTAMRVARVAVILATENGLMVRVEGHSDSTGREGEDFSYRRAAAVRSALVRSGVPADWVTAQGYGNSRPLVANTSAGGRMRNRRVEITISGESIGTVPTWDRTYSLR